MFGTLRYNAQNDDTEFIERITNLIDAEGDGKGLRYSACDKCRLKKQKCGGQRDGCDRCKRNFSICVYSLQGKGKGNRHRRNTKSTSMITRDSSLRSPGPLRPSSDLETTDRELAGRTTTTTQHILMARNEEDSQDSTNSGYTPTSTSDDDFIVSDQMMDEIMFDFDGQNIDINLDASIMSNIDDMDFDDIFVNGPFGSSPEDALSSSPSIARQQSLPDRDFEINLSTTPPPSQPTKRYCTDHRTKSASTCRCFGTISLLLSEFEAKAQPSNHSAKLDSILVFQKEALARSNSVLSCPTCFLRPEYVLLLSMVMERLVSMFESTVDKHLDSVSCTQHTFRQAAAPAAAPANVSHHQRNPPLDGESKICLGSYEIETPDESNKLMRVLLAMQLKTLWKFTAGMKKAAESEISSKSKVQALQKRVVRLLRTLRHFRS